jgi:hypothetical protein
VQLKQTLGRKCVLPTRSSRIRGGERHPEFSPELHPTLVNLPTELAPWRDISWELAVAFYGSPGSSSKPGSEISRRAADERLSPQQERAKEEVRQAPQRFGSSGDLGKR